MSTVSALFPYIPDQLASTHGIVGFAYTTTSYCVLIILYCIALNRVTVVKLVAYQWLTCLSKYQYLRLLYWASLISARLHHSHTSTLTVTNLDQRLQIWIVAFAHTTIFLAVDYLFCTVDHCRVTVFKLDVYRWLTCFSKHVHACSCIITHPQASALPVSFPCRWPPCKSYFQVYIHTKLLKL